MFHLRNTKLALSQQKQLSHSSDDVSSQSSFLIKMCESHCVGTKYGASRKCATHTSSPYCRCKDLASLSTWLKPYLNKHSVHHSHKVFTFQIYLVLPVKWLFYIWPPINLLARLNPHCLLSQVCPCSWRLVATWKLTLPSQMFISCRRVGVSREKKWGECVHNL